MKNGFNKISDKVCKIDEIKSKYNGLELSQEVDIFSDKHISFSKLRDSTLCPSNEIYKRINIIAAKYKGYKKDGLKVEVMKELKELKKVNSIMMGNKYYENNNGIDDLLNDIDKGKELNIDNISLDDEIMFGLDSIYVNHFISDLLNGLSKVLSKESIKEYNYRNDSFNNNDINEIMLLLNENREEKINKIANSIIQGFKLSKGSVTNIGGRISLFTNSISNNIWKFKEVGHLLLISGTKKILENYISFFREVIIKVNKINKDKKYFRIIDESKNIISGSKNIDINPSTNMIGGSKVKDYLYKDTYSNTIYQLNDSLNKLESYVNKI